jgi:hypothetical protein
MPPFRKKRTGRKWNSIGTAYRGCGLENRIFCSRFRRIARGSVPPSGGSGDSLGLTFPSDACKLGVELDGLLPAGMCAVESKRRRRMADAAASIVKVSQLL